MTWLMIQMQSMSKKLSFHERSNQVRSVIKTRQDNNVTHSRSLVYVENNTELSWLIRLSVVYDETRQDNDVTDLPCAVYIANEIELLWPTGLGAVYHEN